MSKLSFLRLAYWYYRKHLPLRLALTSDINLDVLKSFDNITINHPYGITIGRGVKIGKHCHIEANVCIGNKHPQPGRLFSNQELKELMPIIGNFVYIGNSAVILGPVTIGNYATIGANSTILKDVPENSVVCGLWK